MKAKKGRCRVSWRGRIGPLQAEIMHLICWEIIRVKAGLDELAIDYDAEAGQSYALPNVGLSVEVLHRDRCKAEKPLQGIDLNAPCK